MPIKVGDRLPPDIKFRVMGPDGPIWKTTEEVFKGKKVVLFAVPGAFTPTCNNNHLPGFLKNVDAFKGKGIDTVTVTGINDVFVFDAWKKSTGAGGKIEFLADGNGEFAKALDMTMDGSGGGLGIRSKRYAMLVEGGVVKKLNVEDVAGKRKPPGRMPCSSSCKQYLARRNEAELGRGPAQNLREPARRRFKLTAAIAAAVEASSPASGSRSISQTGCGGTAYTCCG